MSTLPSPSKSCAVGGLKSPRSSPLIGALVEHRVALRVDLGLAVVFEDEDTGTGGEHDLGQIVVIHVDDDRIHADQVDDVGEQAVTLHEVGAIPEQLALRVVRLQPGDELERAVVVEIGDHGREAVRASSAFHFCSPVAPSNTAVLDDHLGLAVFVHVRDRHAEGGALIGVVAEVERDLPLHLARVVERHQAAQHLAVQAADRAASRPRRSRASRRRRCRPRLERCWASRWSRTRTPCSPVAPSST